MRHDDMYMYHDDDIYKVLPVSIVCTLLQGNRIKAVPSPIWPKFV
jgi:hypothetical protein